LRTKGADTKFGARAKATRAEALEAWARIGRALTKSGDPENLRLAVSLRRFIMDMAVTRNEVARDAFEQIKSRPGRGGHTLTHGASPSDR
jgi:hypothetical protein